MDPEIQFGEIEHAPPQTHLRPDRNRHFAVVPVFAPGDRDLPIFVDLDVMRDMEEHALSDTRVELGGVLLGGQFADESGKPFVLVSDSLRAQHYESTKGSFKFTHDTWEQITRERELFPPDLQMVGWYHTHPDWGVFLSGMDMFICENFFNKPLDVALVIDPCQGDRGFFQWTRGDKAQTRRTNGFYLMASRFRVAELQSFAAELQGPTSMPATTKHPSQLASYPAPVVNLALPSSLGQTLGILGMLSLQFCFLMLITWRLLFPVEAAHSAAGPAASASADLASVRQREAEIDAKLEVLEQIVRQGSDAPEGVLKSLAEQTALVDELRSSLRGQQSLAKELDQKIVILEGSLADATRVDKEQRTEIAELQAKVTRLTDQLADSRAQLKAIAAREDGADDGEGSSWWSRIWAHSRPIGLGALLGMLTIGAVLAVVQRIRRAPMDGPPGGADEAIER